MKRSQVLALTLILAAALLSQKAMAADTTIFTCASISSTQAGTSALPISFLAMRSSGAGANATFTVTSDFLGKKSTTTDVVSAESAIDDQPAIAELINSVAPGTDSSLITRGVFVELPRGMANDAPIKFIDFRKADGTSVITVVDIAGGSVMGQCTK